MSATKDYFLQMEEKQCMLWIHQQYGIDIDPDEKTALWDELYAEYRDMLDAEQAEYEWLERHSHNQFFREFSADLAKSTHLLTLGAGSSLADTTCKLVYAHAVTLLEALISTVVRKLVISKQHLMLSLVAEYEALSRRTITLRQFAREPSVVEDMVLKMLSELSFHNVATIREILGAMFGEHMKGLELGELARICNKRHDIVHRNGKNVNDEPIELITQEVEQAIGTIKDFAADLKQRIYNALDEQEHEMVCD